jgi:hypothetical protein
MILPVSSSFTLFSINLPLNNNKKIPKRKFAAQTRTVYEIWFEAVHSREIELMFERAEISPLRAGGEGRMKFAHIEEDKSEFDDKY